jgi:osmotically-inducible protein OsmY
MLIGLPTIIATAHLCGAKHYTEHSMTPQEHYTLKHMVAPVTSVALVTAFSVSTAIGANSKSLSRSDSNAQKYWAEFRQDKAQSWNSNRQAYRDGWSEGQLATALSLNEHLSDFTITAKVDQATATLTGTVASNIDKELANNIATGMKYIEQVNNQLTVDSALSEHHASSEGRNFSEYMTDISTTAALKTELLASSNLNGLSINIDTYLNEVTLTGKVDSEAQRTLAESMALKHPNIESVDNQLTLEPQ